MEASVLQQEVKPKRASSYVKKWPNGRPKESQQRFGNTNGRGRMGYRQVEASIGEWYKEPVLKTVLTEDLATQIAECYFDGFNDEDTALLCDVAESTLKNWRNLSVIRKPQAQRKTFYIHEIRDGKRRDWTRLAWWLERRYPLEFSRPEVAHAISTSIHNVSSITNNLIVSAEIAEQLAERNARVGVKIEELFANQTSNRQVDSTLLGDATPIQSVNPALASDYVQSVDLTNASKVRDITQGKDVIATAKDGVVIRSQCTHAGSEEREGWVLPSLGAGAPTDPLSPTQPQKTEQQKKIELEGKLKRRVEKQTRREVLLARLQERQKAKKVDQAELKKANRLADKIHPRHRKDRKAK